MLIIFSIYELHALKHFLHQLMISFSVFASVEKATENYSTFFRKKPKQFLDNKIIKCVGGLGYLRSERTLH